MNRRTWLQALGLGILTGPVTVEEMLASEEVSKEDFTRSIRPVGQGFVECGGVHNYEPFIMDICAYTGDLLKVNHTIRSIRRMRHWEVLRYFCAVGVCVEGLVIREPQLVLASIGHVKLVFDDTPEI